MSQSSSWPPERVAALERFWTDGLSATEIAARFPGITRNAVLGKLHRLGRLGRGRPTVPAKVRPAKPARAAPLPSHRPRVAVAADQTVAPVMAPAWAGQVGAVEALSACHCRWPIGDPHEVGFAFCGRRVRARPYCEAHRAVAYQPASAAKGQRRAKGNGVRRAEV